MENQADTLYIYHCIDSCLDILLNHTTKDSSESVMKKLQEHTNDYELHIKIESDREFYNNSYKTGLGSSSALVTSLCGSIYSLFLYINIL